MSSFTITNQHNTPIRNRVLNTIEATLGTLNVTIRFFGDRPDQATVRIAAGDITDTLTGQVVLHALDQALA